MIEFSLCLLFAKLVSYTFLYWLPLYIFNVGESRGRSAERTGSLRVPGRKDGIAAYDSSVQAGFLTPKVCSGV